MAPHLPTRRGLAISLALSLTVAAGAVEAADPPRGFTDGTWSGALAWRAAIDAGEVSGEGKVTGGGFELQVAGGQVSGSFQFTADGSSTGPDGAFADLAIGAIGTGGGTAEFPLLVGTSVSVTGTAGASGITVPVDITFGAGELDPIELDIVTASCAIVTGNFATQIAQTQATLGSAASLNVFEARWSATRTGAAGLTEAQHGVLNDLVTDATALEAQIDAGTYDATALFSVLSRAATFSGSLPESDACGVSAPGHFTTVVSGIVAQILDKMLANSGLFTAGDFQSLVVAALAAGIVGPAAGSAGAERTTQLNSTLRALFDLAVADSDVGALYSVFFAAQGLGNTELAAAALAAAKAL